MNFQDQTLQLHTDPPNHSTKRPKSSSLKVHREKERDLTNHGSQWEELPSIWSAVVGLFSNNGTIAGLKSCRCLNNKTPLGALWLGRKRKKRAWFEGREKGRMEGRERVTWRCCWWSSHERVCNLVFVRNWRSPPSLICYPISFIVGWGPATLWLGITVTKLHIWIKLKVNVFLRVGTHENGIYLSLLSTIFLFFKLKVIYMLILVSNFQLLGVCFLQFMLVF